MFGLFFKFFAVAIACVLVAYMLANTFRNSRRLDARIRAFKKEQEEAKKSGRVLDPYAELAQLYTDPEAETKKARRRSRRS